MSRSLVVVLVALALAGSALAQTVGRPGAVGWFGDEPNVPDGGTLPYTNVPGSVEESARYPADANGMKPARAGEATLVLGAAWYQRNNAFVNPADVDTGELLAPFGAGPYLVGVGQFVAWYGTWADLNGDGWLTDPEIIGAPVYVDASSRQCDAQELRTDDAQGVGVADPTTIEEEGEDPDYLVQSGVSYRCRHRDEWTPAATTEIVGYLTPGTPQGPSDMYLSPSREPDMTFTAISGGEGGRYFAPQSNWHFVFADGSTLQTTVTEVISKPALDLDGERAKVPGEGSLLDVDLYRSVDPLLESLYQENVAETLHGQDCDARHPENVYPDESDCPRAVKDGVPAVPNADAVVDPVVGPEQAKYVPPRGNENPGAHADGPHAYLDARLEYSRYYSVWAADDAPVFGFSHTGSGQAQAPIYAGVYGVLGVWHDKDHDTWIGSPQATDGCEDAHDCGTVPDPNDYGDTGPDGEWRPSCRPGARLGEATGRLTSSLGHWGLGAYVITDRKFVGIHMLDPERDEYERDGRVAFMPYDDVVLDASDGNVDHLVVSGPLDFHWVCDPADLIPYKSYEHWVMLSSNQGFDVTVTIDAFEVDFTSLGAPSAETVTDTDVLRAWAL